jgi:hypothetical protein
MSADVTVILDSERTHDACAITGEIDRSDPGDPCIRLEAGCNELWLNAEEARAVLAYLSTTIPLIEKGGEDG